MKKSLISIILVLALLLSVGCGNNKPAETTAVPETTPAPVTTLAPTTTLAPATTLAPVTTAEPTETTAPEASVEPETSAEPDASVEPETTPAPETDPATEPAVTDAPEETPTPEVTPEITEPESDPVGKESTPVVTASAATEPTVTDPIETPETEPSTTEPPEPMINGVAISEYTIIYSENCLDYTLRAARYIRDEIEKLIGIKLNMLSDRNEIFDHEIVVGETSRPISTSLDVSTENVQFSLMAEDGHIALEGQYFVIAAAAYYFVETYVGTDAIVPTEATVCAPIVEETKNIIFLIGDGMGLYQTLLFDAYDGASIEYSDGEDFFYGYLFPSSGFARTDSLSGVTDSAASGTALASGFKTNNGYVGKQGFSRNVKSLTEIAGELGMATAVMSTEVQTGATPGAFSAHAQSRNDTETILASQATLVEKYGTIIKANFDYYTKNEIKTLESAITDTLTALSENENGFFIMYEEAYIDKHCHSNQMDNAFKAVVRFNQAIGLFMEYAFYNPDTFVLITADHETGKLLPNGNGGFSYGSGDHTAMYVPVFAYGMNSELFEGKIIENIQIPKTMASFWGYEIKGTDNENYPALTK